MSCSLVYSVSTVRLTSEATASRSTSMKGTKDGSLGTLASGPLGGGRLEFRECMDIRVGRGGSLGLESSGISTEPYCVSDFDGDEGMVGGRDADGEILVGGS